MHHTLARAARLVTTVGVSVMLVGVSAAFAAGPAIPEGTGMTSWVENGEGGVYLLELREGGLPEGEASVVGEVLSDSNCAPDADNINHCENVIRFSDGSTLMAVNNHRMAVNRCLRRGEKVYVSNLEEGWLVVSTGAE
ncbi:hypothetical protein JET14_10300 [Martelella lutilitoris]|uniref:Uncharacterized protein n=1 Tax=Martelella lutilitoris TaxID=2583532 RepID=A0A7T7HGM0_9HYPH|nr:hypothetical protein [Martelella lutilitoris]QQM28762.1 hypothetical protein JET14_10300 [Martelella lutilitoris]